MKTFFWPERISITAAVSVCLCLVWSAEIPLSSVSGTPGAERQLVLGLLTAAAARNWEQLEVLQSQIIEKGSNVVDEIEAEYAAASVELRGALLDTVRRIPGESPNKLLVKATFEDPDQHNSLVALNCLEARVLSGMSFELTESETATAVRELKEGTSPRSEAWAHILLHLRPISDDELADALLEGFLARLQHPVQDVPSWPGIISYPAHWLKTMMIDWSRLKSDRLVRSLRAEYEKRNEKGERAWFLIGRGFAGDVSAAQSLEEIVDNFSEDISLRASALQALVVCAGRGAKPVLLRYADDGTPVPGRASHVHPLSVVARDGLVDVERLSTSPTVETDAGAP
jgi:hypothetical protein